jgi:sialic acid synthase SpsE
MNVTFPARTVSTRFRAYLYARRSVTSQVAIRKGTAITREMLTYKRPGTGINAKHLDLVVGRMARADISADTTITWEMV